MAFGQQSGPPATGKQLQQLLALLEAAGHTGFRDARGPMGFTQRQAGGKFTRDEADAFIEQLQQEAEGQEGTEPAPTPSSAPTPRPAPAPAPRRSTAEQAVRRMPSELLAAELQRRGWVVLEP